MIKSYDIIGNIVILKFPEKTLKKDKIKSAKEILERHKNVKTVLEKTGKVKGRLRTIKTKYILGQKNLIAEYVENNCKFRFNVETCYFSPRLSNERKEIYLQIKKNEKVLVIFSGVGPYSIEIAKNSLANEVYSIELGKECYKYALENVKLNKLSNVRILQGDVKKIVKKGGLNIKGNLVPLQFDRIVMPRPQLKDSFLKEAFMVAKKNTIIHYYDFGKDQNVILSLVKKEAKKYKKKVKILKIKKAGNIAPYKFRWRIDFRVYN